VFLRRIGRHTLEVAGHCARQDSNPYFSPGGKYVVSVTMDKDGSPAKAAAMGTAGVNGFHADLSVTLDLRNLPRGTCYLATTHESDRASYYYPLTVR